MKTFPKAPFFLLLLALFACSEDDNCLGGSGQIVDETREVPAFTEVWAQLSGNVLVTQGTTQEVVVRSHANVVSRVTTEVQNGQLFVGLEGCVQSLDQLDILVTMPVIDALVLDGSGNISGQNSFELEQTELILNGSGNIQVRGNFIQMESTINGSGNLILGGRAQQLQVRITGSGNISSFDLISNNCTVFIDGSGNAEVTASDSLQVTITGSGIVSYLGDPVIEANVSGSGDVIKGP